MKRNKYNHLVLGLGIITVLGLSCSKDRKLELRATEQNDLSNLSTAQAYNAVVGSLRNYLYVDGTPVNGATIAYASVFPLTSLRFSFQPGLRNFLLKDTLATSTQPQLNFAENVQTNSNYTVFLYDTFTAPKQITVPTNIVIPDDTTARIRFANFVHSKVAIPAVDIFSVKRQANIFTNVQVTQVTEFIPIASGITDTFYVRPTGTTTNLVNFTPATPAPGNQPVTIQAALTPTQKRSYTIVFRGSYFTTLSTSAAVKGLGIFVNQ